MHYRRSQYTPTTWALLQRANDLISQLEDLAEQLAAEVESYDEIRDAAQDINALAPTLIYD